ncbi:peptidoglycan D,D-transpeptidase FtsI family protein [Desulfolucanica intricata]|uniref:peptidoglycan D,D-transpeptidase FtsI family protein n=1 Tax=Desulfolucanica intricata TaxID=1285191 RepID=UPI0008309F5D|nr:penicillin-binding transpeptidase domain-containing protein [Desulfolucanica intricata]
MKKNILRMSYLLLGAFCFLILYLGYIQIIKGPELTASTQNKRLLYFEKSIHRGGIYDRSGEVLAYSEKEGSRKRVYPKGAFTAPVIGFISERYGRSGIESAADRYLLGITTGGRFDKFISRISNKDLKGYDLVLTLDASIQELAMNLLGQRKGAVVVLNPQNGDVLALASSPTFDPSQIDAQWSNLSKNPDSPLLNRATQGAYPPGSTFKIITEAAALTDSSEVAGRDFNCPGYLSINGFKLKDNAVHGRIDLTEALAVSCNTTFAELGLTLGDKKLVNGAKAFGFGQDPGLEIPVRVSTISSGKELAGAKLAATAIGQGEVLASPLQMALAAAAVANNGIIMKPHLISEVRDGAGNVIYRYKTGEWLNAVTRPVAEEIKRGMEEAVTAGTAKKAAINGIRVAGKTGSAENPNGPTHAWFIGFAPVENPKLAVAVIVENAGSGGNVAAPVARDIISAFVSD